MWTSLEIVFAVAAAATTMLILARLMRRGTLDACDPWWADRRMLLCFVPPICGLAMIFLKVLEYNADNPHSFGPWPWHCGVCRRLDDISFWTLIYGYGLCFFVAGPTRGVKLAATDGNADGASVRRWWTWSAGIAVGLYLVAAWYGSGTFFWWNASAEHPAIVKTLQIVEGVLVIVQMEVAYVFICLMLHHFGAQRLWVRVYAALLVGIVVLLFGANEVSHRVGELCRPSNATGSDGCLGVGEQKTYRFGRFWACILLVWWPIVLMFVLLPFLETRRVGESRAHYVARVVGKNKKRMAIALGVLASIVTLWQFVFEKLASKPTAAIVQPRAEHDAHVSWCGCAGAAERKPERLATTRFVGTTAADLSGRTGD